MGRQMPEFYKSRAFQLTVLVVAAMSLLVALPILFGVIHPVKMPSNSMAPTIKSNDVFWLEKFSFWARHPERGEIVAHLSDGSDGMPANRLFVKRVIALPNEHLVLSNGTLWIDGHPRTLTNQFGPLAFHHP